MTWLRAVLLIVALGLAAWLASTLWFVLLERRHVPENRFRPDLERPPPDAREDVLVLVLHGTLYPAPTMRPLAAGLEAAGFRCWMYEYRYLQPLEENGRLLEQAMTERLAAAGAPPPATILGVGYSQGGMILRWLLSGNGDAAWLDRVHGLVQIASPNLGSPVALLERGTFPALRKEGAFFQLSSGSVFLEELGARPMLPEVRVGLIYGEGSGQHFLERLLFGRLVGSAFLGAVGRWYEARFFAEGPHDGLVPVASAVGLLSQLDLSDSPAPRRIDTDHLGLMTDPEARRALVELVEELAP